MKNLTFRDQVRLNLFGFSFAVTLMLAASDSPLFFLCGAVITYLQYRGVSNLLNDE